MWTFKSPSALTGDAQCGFKCLAWRFGSSAALKMLNRTYSTQFREKKMMQSRNISRGVLVAEIQRQAPLNQVRSLFELSSLVFTSKDIKRGNEKQDSQPPIPLPWVNAVCGSRALSRNNQHDRQSLTIKVSISRYLILTFHCCASLSCSVIRPSY